MCMRALPACMSVQHIMSGVPGSQKSVLDSQEFQTGVTYTMWVLGTESGSSGKAASVLNH